MTEDKIYLKANLVSDDAVGVSERVGLDSEPSVGDDIERVRREHLLGVETRAALRQVAQVRHKVVANLFQGLKQILLGHSSRL